MWIGLHRRRAGRAIWRSKPTGVVKRFGKVEALS
jgi:hypothetical protein